MRNDMHTLAARCFLGNETARSRHDVTPCPIATRFEQKLQQLLFAPLEQHAPTGITRNQINQAKFLLQEEWHTWRCAMPTYEHHAACGKHRCLLQVYDAAYDRLQLLALSLFPTVDVLSDFPASTNGPVPGPELRGIFIGETAQ